MKKKDWTWIDELDDIMYEFAVWLEEHPFKAMFFIEIPLSVITSLLTIMLLT